MTWLEDDGCRLVRRDPEGRRSAALGRWTARSLMLDDEGRRQGEALWFFPDLLCHALS